VSGLQTKARLFSPQPGHYSNITRPNLQPTATQERNDQCGNRHYSCEFLMPETCSAYKKYNKIISGIWLVFILQLSQWCTDQQTSESNESFTNPTSTVELELLTLITENNAKMRDRWCDHKTWTADGWKYVIWSDESPFLLLRTPGRVGVWRTPKETYNPECLVPAAERGVGLVMIWAAMSCYSAGPIINLNGRIEITFFKHTTP